MVDPKELDYYSYEHKNGKRMFECSECKELHENKIEARICCAEIKVIEDGESKCE